MEEKLNKESVEELSKQIDKTISNQKKNNKHLEARSERNKKIFMILIIVLAIFFIATNIYVHLGLNLLNQELFSQK